MSLSKPMNFEKIMDNPILSRQDKQRIQIYIDSFKSGQQEILDNKYELEANIAKAQLDHDNKNTCIYNTLQNNIDSINDVLTAAKEVAKEVAKIQRKRKNNANSKRYTANLKAYRLAFPIYEMGIQDIFNDFQCLMSSHEYNDNVIYALTRRFKDLLEPLQSSCKHCTSQKNTLKSCVLFSDVQAYVDHPHDIVVSSAFSDNEELRKLMKMPDKFCVLMHVKLGGASRNDYFCCMCKNIYDSDLFNIP